MEMNRQGHPEGQSHSWDPTSAFSLFPCAFPEPRAASVTTFPTLVWAQLP